MNKTYEIIKIEKDDAILGVIKSLDMHWVYIIQLGLYGVYECIYLYVYK